MERFYREHNANIQRGVHELAEEATQLYEEARQEVAQFLKAGSPREIVFVRGTTEALNLLAWCLGRAVLHPGDEILLTEMEHHSNIVPWQWVAEVTGVRLQVARILDNGEIDCEDWERKLTDKTRIVTFPHASNVLGTLNPVRHLARLAHRFGAVVVVDGAQAAGHIPVDVQELECDFYAFSGHKALGPMGIGVLYGRWECLERLPPYQGGGGMIQAVFWDRTLVAPPPRRFEAGTPNVAGAVGLAVALQYLRSVGMDTIRSHEQKLIDYAQNQLSSLPGIRLVADPKERIAIVSFVVEGVHAHDVATILDREGVAVRAGHHCAMPLMNRLGFSGTVRASFALYNTFQEVDQLVLGLKKVWEIFGHG
ncbi:putative cysteine desulfurase [Candidatus Methylacidithermus pantelleriae]|uniref:Cysteine desulfurase n=2 Tax=Candidatus Methylacidithermus pantelleriae TaxID=2744239 RepID=A0A8J2BRL8_9BACT|nr:putative cysteine desulfurase [Candidatus Methylacidithermus pantelleriae]